MEQSVPPVLEMQLVARITKAIKDQQEITKDQQEIIKATKAQQEIVKATKDQQEIVKAIKEQVMHPCQCHYMLASDHNTTRSPADSLNDH